MIDPGLAPDPGACRQCGGQIPAGSLFGACPVCALREGIHTPDSQGSGDWSPGLVVGEWVLEEVLGRGGSGTVHLARHTSLGTVVVVKVLSRALALDDSARYRFAFEAGHDLAHPHIVPILSSGEHEGRPYLVLPYFAGGNLDQWIGRVWHRKEVSGFARLPGPEEDGFHPKIARFMADLARAVSFAHERGLIHRDLKPGNILLDMEGNPHVADFGSSRRLDLSERLSNTGMICGSPEYLAPEIASGRCTEGTIASDVYGLGVVLFEILSGSPPYSGPNVMATLQRIATGPDPSLRARNPRVPRDLARIGQICLSRDPAARYRTAAEVADDLDRFSRGEPLSVAHRTAWHQLWAWGRRNRQAAALTAAFLVVLSGTSAVATLEWVRASRAAEEQRREVVGQWIHNGIDAVKSGNSIASLPWLAAAWRSDESHGASPERIRLHQRRFIDAARKLPDLEQVRALPFAVKVLATSQDGQWVAAAGSDSRDGISVWHHSGLEDSMRRFPASEAVFQLSFTHPDNHLLVQSMDARQVFSVTLLEVDTGRRRFHRPMPDRINTAESSPDGRWIAVGCRDGSLRVIGARDGAAVAEFQHAGQVRRLAWISPERLVSVGYDNWARIWEPGTGRFVTGWEVGEYLRETVVSPLGGWLAFGGDNRRATVVDVESLTVRSEMLHPGWVTAMTASKSGKLLATGDRLGNIRVWDAVSGRPQIDWLIAQGLEVRRLAFSLDDRILTAHCADRTLRSWSVSDGRMLGSILPMEVEPVSIGWLPTNRVVTVTARGTSQIWSMEGLTGKGDPRPLRGGLQKAITSESGRWTALHLGDKGVFVEDNHRPEQAPWELTAASDVVNMAFQPGTTRLLVHGRTPQLAVWELESRGRPPLWIPMPAPLAAIRFSPSGRWLACGSQTGHLQVRQVDLATGTGQLPVSFETRFPVTGTVTVQLRWSPDERFLFVGVASSHWVVARSEDQPSLFILDTRSGAVSSHSGLGIAEVMALEVSSTGDWLAVAGLGGKVRLIRLKPGFELGPLIAPPNVTSCLQFDRDRQRLWTGGYDQTIRLWDLPSGRLLRSDLRLSGSIRNIALTRDGTMMLAGAESGHVGIWDAETLEPVSVRSGPIHPIRFCNLSADSRWALFGGSDRRLHRISLEKETLRREEAELMMRALAPFEIDQAGRRIDLSVEESHAAWSRWRQIRRREIGSR